MSTFFARSIRGLAGCALATAIFASHAQAVCESHFGVPIPTLTGDNPHFMAAGDFNEDDVVDFAVSNGDLTIGSPNSNLVIILGKGNREYEAPVPYLVGFGARGVVAGDFNEDGITDLAVANIWTNNISVLIGQGASGVGDGTFADATNYPAGTGPFEIVTGDFNRDGILDLATALNGLNAVTVLPGLGTGGVGDGTFGSPVIFPIASASTGLATADLNDDGVLDLVATENNSGSIGILLGTGVPTLGSGSFFSATHQSMAGIPFHVEIADFNEDGDPDLAVSCGASAGVAIHLGNGDGTFSSGQVLGQVNSASAAIADVDEDGILDVLAGHVTGSNTGHFELYLGQGVSGVGNGTFGPGTAYASSGDVYQLIAGDFDEDGFVDVLTSEGYGNRIALVPGVCEELPPDPRLPVLTDVRDVPNDNGGKVFLTWTASSLDAPNGPVNSYRVWRRIPPGAMTEVLARRMALSEVIAMPMPGRANEIVYWEALVTLPAQRLEGYGFTAPTTQDSMPHSNPYTAFFVSALTASIDVFYSSNVDSGYSVDNIPPRRPDNLTGQVLNSGLQLQWDAVVDPDLSAYRIYRSELEGFEPSVENLAGTTEEITWLDPGAAGLWYYKVSAVDIHENESDYALLTPATPLDVESPTGAVFALHAVGPNPSAGGQFSVRFSLADGAAARLDVLDLAGRKVRSQNLSALGPGPHVVSVGGDRPLAPGIYLVRLMQAGRSRQAKAVVLQ